MGLREHSPRTAVVTGGAQGIGLATARSLQSGGYEVHIFDVTEGPDNVYRQAIVSGASFHTLDVTDAEAVERAFDRLPRVDVLVTSAGIAGLNTPLRSYPIDEWRRIMSVNLDGTFFCLRAAAPKVIAQNYGRIVTVSSIAGKEGNPNASAFGFQSRRNCFDKVVGQRARGLRHFSQLRNTRCRKDTHL